MRAQVDDAVGKALMEEVPHPAHLTLRHTVPAIKAQKETSDHPDSSDDDVPLLIPNPPHHQPPAPAAAIYKTKGAADIVQLGGAAGSAAIAGPQQGCIQCYCDAGIERRFRLYQACEQQPVRTQRAVQGCRTESFIAKQS